VMMDMALSPPVIGIEGQSGYARYFDAMAYGVNTKQRLAIAMQSDPSQGQVMGAEMQVDRNDDNQVTVLSQSNMTTNFGPVRTDFALGGLSEQGRLLGGEMTGALAVNSSHTIFAKTGFAWPINALIKLDGFYEIGRSKLDFKNDDLVSADTIWSDSYGLALTAIPDETTEIFITLRRPVAITKGGLGINTLTGYQADGSYRADQLNYKLSPRQRETEFLAEYRKQFFPGNVVAWGLQHQENANNIAGLKTTGGYFRSEWIF